MTTRISKILDNLNDLDNNDLKLSWLRISRANINFNSIIYFLQKYRGDIAKVIELLEQKKSFVISKVLVQEELAEIERLGLNIIFPFDKTYPPHILNISDPPLVLSTRGNLSLLQQKQNIAVVGARNASSNGLYIAQELSEELSKNHYIITSGLARGIDTAAHRGSLLRGTIAVMGTGIDHVYPKENNDIFNKIIDSGGLIISEYPLGTPPIGFNFPKRNRIISGLAKGVVIVEAAEKSGTLITANCALDQGKDLFAVPGSPLDFRSRGTNKLIKDGALLIENASDIISFYNENIFSTNCYREKLNFSSEKIEDLSSDDQDIDETRENNINNYKKYINDIVGHVLTDISLLEMMICEKIGQKIRSQDLQIAITELELEGIITKRNNGLIKEI